MAKVKPNRADNRYEVKVPIGRDGNGKTIRKSFYSTKSKSDAQNKADNWLVEHKAKQLAGIEDVQEVTFSFWARFWLKNYKEGKVKENTYSESYERPVEKILIPYFNDTTLNSIIQADIERFYGIQAKHYADSTLHKLKLCLNGIFESAIDNQKCVRNPAKKVKYLLQIESKEKRSYTQEQYDTIISFAQSNLDSLPDGLPIWIEAECALRPEELFGLDFSDFDLDSNTVHIQRAVVDIRGVPTMGNVKNKRSNRILPISINLSQTLRNYPRKGLVVGKLLDSSKWSGRRYKKWFDALCKKYPDMPRYTPHELRHTRGSLLYKATGDIYAVSRFLGHSSVKVTEMIYIHIDVEDLRKQLCV